MEERKRKIAKDKRINNIVKARSVRKHEGEIIRVVAELKNESRARNMQIQEMKDRERSQN